MQKAIILVRAGAGFEFLWQRGRCRHCGDRISFQYPLVEIISGLIAVAVPAVLFGVYDVAYLSAIGENIGWFYVFSAIWILVFGLVFCFP